MGDERYLESSNLKSALSQPQVLSAKLDKERAAGRIAGILSEFRLIHHLSYPKGSSVNDYIFHKNFPLLSMRASTIQYLSSNH